jgi:hypothetical protein
MTTPSPSASPASALPQVWILQDVQPQNIIQQQAESVSYLLANADLNNSVYVSTASNVGPGGSNSYTIGPLGSIAITSASQWWACTDAGATTELDVLPGGSSESPAPGQIAEVIAPLASAIAQQIFETGIQTVAAPTSMYNVGSTGGGTGSTGLVGGTIPAQAFQQTGCYDFGKSQIQCDNQFTGFVLRDSAGGHLTSTKKFWNLSDWSLTKNDLQNYGSFGTRVIFALKPVAPPFGPITNAEKTNLTNFLNAIKGAPFNFTASTAQIILWQEADNGKNFTSTGQAQYAAMLAAYGPIVNAAGLPLMISVGASAGITSNNNFLNAALGVAGVTYQGYYVDLYFGAWNGGYDATQTFSVADAAGIPACGFSEIGCHVTDNFAAYFTQATGPPGIITVMQDRLQANKSNLDVDWYQGQCSATGVGDLTSPILTATDPRIPFYQQLFDTLTASSGAAFTIAANSTVTVAPVNPSPIGNLAPSQFLSYEISLELTAGVASTVPFISLTLLWFDFDQVPKNQTPVYKEVWHLPMGANGDANGPLVVYGGGRQHGGFLQVKINNQDTVACTVNTFQLFGTARPGARSALTWNPNANVSPAVPMPGITGNAQSADQSLQIGREYGVNIPAGQAKSWINGVWAGEAYFRAHVTGAVANDVAFELQPLPSGVFGAGTDIFHQLIGAAGNIEILPTKLALPRSPTLMLVTNNDANPVTIEYLLIGVDTS